MIDVHTKITTNTPRMININRVLYDSTRAIPYEILFSSPFADLNTATRLTKRPELLLLGRLKIVPYSVPLWSPIILNTSTVSLLLFMFIILSFISE